MKNRIAVGLIMSCLWSSFSFSQTGLPQPVIDSIERIISREMARQQIPGLSIAIGIDDRLVWKQAYGFADLENFVPVTTETRFRSASVGKPMTATAVLQLAEEGRLALDDEVQQYCPAFPEKHWPVTVRHLLTQQSGIRYYREEEVTNVAHYSYITDPLCIFEADTLLFEPGTDFQYTSFNYNLLGCVIEGAAGMTYSRYMQEEVFEPEGMEHTVVDDNYQIIPGRARGYVRDESQLVLSLTD